MLYFISKIKIPKSSVKYYPSFLKSIVIYLLFSCYRSKFWSNNVWLVVAFLVCFLDDFWYLLLVAGSLNFSFSILYAASTLESLFCFLLLALFWAIFWETCWIFSLLNAKLFSFKNFLAYTLFNCSSALDKTFSSFWVWRLSFFTKKGCRQISLSDDLSIVFSTSLFCCLLSWKIWFIVSFVNLLSLPYFEVGLLRSRVFW